jgi:hypothetical protein
MSALKTHTATIVKISDMSLSAELADRLYDMIGEAFTLTSDGMVQIMSLSTFAQFWEMLYNDVTAEGDTAERLSLKVLEQKLFVLEKSAPADSVWVQV